MRITGPLRFFGSPADLELEQLLQELRLVPGKSLRPNHTYVHWKAEDGRFLDASKDVDGGWTLWQESTPWEPGKPGGWGAVGSCMSRVRVREIARTVIREHQESLQGSLF